MRTLRAVAALLGLLAAAASLLVGDPQGTGLRAPAGLLLVIVGAMAIGGHLVPLRRAGLLAGAAALLGGLALVVVGRAGVRGVALGVAIAAAQAAPAVARRVCSRSRPA